MSWASAALVEWLPDTPTGNGAYRHRRVDENPVARSQGLAALGELVTRAHEDARKHLAAVTGIDLDPIDGDQDQLALQYPDDLDATTLQAYLGEIFAGLVAENYALHDREWEMPAFLFRFHGAAVEALERRRQLGGAARPVPGRTGDDCIAFVRDPDGQIVAWLMCEAKCTGGHDSHLISDGHKQLSIDLRSPVNVWQLIEIMQSSSEPDAADWVDALRLLLQESHKGNDPPRLDLFLYVCGRSSASGEPWIPRDAPHPDYGRSGPLEAVEVHLRNVAAVLAFVYPNKSAGT